MEQFIVLFINLPCIPQKNIMKRRQKVKSISLMQLKMKKLFLHEEQLNQLIWWLILLAKHLLNLAMKFSLVRWNIIPILFLGNYYVKIAGAIFKVIPMNEKGELLLEEYAKLL